MCLKFRVTIPDSDDIRIGFFFRNPLRRSHSFIASIVKLVFINACFMTAIIPYLH